MLGRWTVSFKFWCMAAYTVWGLKDSIAAHGRSPRWLRSPAYGLPAAAVIPVRRLISIERPWCLEPQAFGTCTPCSHRTGSSVLPTELWECLNYMTGNGNRKRGIYDGMIWNERKWEWELEGECEKRNLYNGSGNGYLSRCIGKMIVLTPYAKQNVKVPYP